ncbi:MAG: hypothetical protein CMA12_07495 [Euryarchaeota archaeon]|nr:hypothetical protein [Euryarchaeota archaeon]
MGRHLAPPAFYTFDPCRISPNLLFGPIISSIQGNHESLLDKMGAFRSAPELKEGKPPKIDSANLLFITSLDWQKDGSAPLPLDRGHSRERLGRFPSNDGNAIEYLIQHLVPEDGGIVLLDLLVKLARGLGEEAIGDTKFSRGAGGIELLGWLDIEDVNSLKVEIERGLWSVSSEEPLDGGVQDAFRHLLVILRASIKRKCGILMRRHS